MTIYSPRFQPKNKAQMIGDPTKRITKFSWGTSGQGASIGNYTYACMNIQVATGTLLFYGLDHTGANNPANIQVLNSYMCDLTYADNSSVKIGLGSTYPLFDTANLTSALTGYAKTNGWWVRQRTNPSGSPTPLISSGNKSGPALTTGTWYALTLDNDDFCVWQFRPSNGGALNAYSFLDFSDDGGVTVAFTIEVNFMRSSSAG